MKYLLLIMSCLFLGNFVFAGTEIDVYKRLYDFQVISTGDMMEIHRNLVTVEDCATKPQAYITLAESNEIRIGKLFIKYCKQQEYKYLLLHEIGHYIKDKYNKVLPMVAIGSYKDKSVDELYAESFAQIYWF